MLACIRFVLPLLALVVGVAAAEPPRTVWLDDLTWTELRDRIKGGATTIIIPIGGTEQNGPHMTLGKHNARVRYLAERIALELGNTLVAPVVAYVPEGSVDPPVGHMRFPGTISVPSATFEATLEAAGHSFRRHGFHDVVLIGDHGGYQKDLRTVADRLNREWRGTGVRAHAIVEYARAAEVDFARALRERGYRDNEIGVHAGLADTSLALAVDPSLVRKDQLGVASAAAAADGVKGDPRRASAELGRVGIDLIVAETVAAIHQSMAHP